MKNNYLADGISLPESERITQFGKFLRETSLDELPELLNVIKGDMSLVGPRPLPVEYLGYYTIEEKGRHAVRPGVTGWAQINGRNSISWEKKFYLDLWYVKNRSFILDLKIVLLTFSRVLLRQGINFPQHSSMPAFTGTQCRGVNKTVTKK